MSIQQNNGFTCKKDGKQMYLVEETTKMSNGVRRAVFYYKCLVCGYRIEAEQVEISSVDGAIVIKRRVKLL